MNNDTLQCTLHKLGKHIYHTRTSCVMEKKKKQESPVDLELSCLAWPLWVNKHSPDLKRSVSQFKFSLLFVHPKLQEGRANSSEQQVSNRKAQRFLFTTGLQRDSCAFGLHSFVLLVYNSADDNWGIRFIRSQQEVLTRRLTVEVWGLMIYSLMKHCLSTTVENFTDKWLKKWGD